MRVLAFDAGGTRIKAGIVGDGSIGSVEVVDTPDGIDALTDAIARAGRSLLDGGGCDAVGMCVPGLVDERGIVVSLPGKLDGLEGFDLPGFLRSAFGARALVCNDAVAYAAGEAARGAGRDVARVVVVTIGTGVGVCVMQDGAPAWGGTFGAGITGGFIPIASAAGPHADSTGRTDTIEALCAAARIVDYAGGSFPDVPAVYEGARAGDPAATEGLDRYRAHLARALVALAHAHTPGCIVIGGGPMVAGTPVIDGLEAAVNERLFGTYRVSVRLASLGDGAALAGLATLAARA